MTTLAVGPTSVELPDELVWVDEFAWSAVEQTESRSLTGARIVQRGMKQGGRPITLRPPDDQAGWITRAVLDQLRAWVQMPGLQLTLTLRGEARVVEFRYNEAAVEAEALVPYDDVQAGDFYLATIRLLET